MSDSTFAERACYEIRVKGHLGESWAQSLGVLTMTVGFDSDGTAITTFCGPVVDQAALHGVLAKIRDLGLQIRRVNRLGPASDEDE